MYNTNKGVGELDYFLTFIEGVISFISPCMLPMLPIYVSYFAAGTDKKHKIAVKAMFFMLGFTIVFISLGLFAAAIGSFLLKYRTAVNIVSGIVVILLGLSYLEVIRIPLFKGMSGGKEINSAISAFLFGVVYSVSLTPCVGAFLGSALVLASNSGTALKGGLLLLFYSLGLGVPFVMSAIILDKLSGVFGFIKRNYKVINAVCGGFLILVGILMCFGLLNKLVSLLG